MKKISGKAYNCIKMLQILSDGRCYKISELIQLLSNEEYRDTPLCNNSIIEYRRTLEYLGYEIKTISGKYGGYQLVKKKLLPQLNFSDAEKEVLIDTYNYISSKPDFLNKDDFKTAFDKLFTNMDFNGINSSKIITLDKVLEETDLAKSASYQKTIDWAIKTKKTLKITYRFLNEGTKEVLIDPYDLYLFHKDWEFTGWIHDKCEIWYLKIRRIENIEVTDKSFSIVSWYKLSDYYSNGIHPREGQNISVTLIAKGLQAKYYKESINKYNEIQIIDDNTVKVLTLLQDNDQTCLYLLSKGAEIEVISPLHFREKIKKFAEDIHNIYK